MRSLQHRLKRPAGAAKPRVDRHTCEVEAESVAYTVCQHIAHLLII